MNKTFCGGVPTDKTNISKIKNQLGKNSETGRLVLKYLILSLFWDETIICSCSFSITINKLHVTGPAFLTKKQKIKEQMTQYPC